MISETYVKGERIGYYSFKAGAKEKALEEVRSLTKEEKGEIVGYHTAGEGEFSFNHHFHISKEYALIPDPKSHVFDKEGYLRKCGLGTNTKYTAEINAQNVTLTDLNYLPHGKDFVLQWSSYFTKTELPMLKVVHHIPKENVYADEISNITGQNNLLKGKIEGLAQGIP